MHNLRYADEAKKVLAEMKKNDHGKKKLKKIKKTLDLLKENPRYPGLHTHKYKSFKGNNGEEIFQSYIENRTPGAFRIFWYYGPDKKDITIVTITTHP